MTDAELALLLAQGVEDRGGRAYFVGGFVRDRLLGLENKDIDMEVHGIAPEALTALLSSLGEVTAFGESFGILGLRHHRLDVAMPRSERAVGTGHRDFLCTVDPFIGTRQAALRRDFTVNALMQDVLTGEIIDHFGGRRDLEAGILRHMDAARFAEDPLRVLRGAQFAARFGFSVAPETLALCRKMDLSDLAPERIFGELEKALLKAEMPSVFFNTLREMEQLDLWFPELKSLIGIPQPPQHHPEGDAWNHTMRVLDASAAMRAQAEEPLYLLLAALCHDLGKAVSTVTEADGRIRAIGHEETGIPLAESLLSRISHEKKLRLYVRNMITLHMLPNIMVSQKAGRKAFNRLFDRSVCPEDLLLLCKADLLGSALDKVSYRPYEEVLRGHLADYRALTAEPGVTGDDLIAAGFRPGTAFREALDYARRLQLAGVSRKEALPQTLAFLRQREAEEAASVPAAGGKTTSNC